MLHNRNIICISSIDWDFVWQGHQEIMDTFARQGNKVLFIENTGVRIPNISDLPRIRKRLANWFRSFRGIKKLKENLFVYSPVILPFPYSGIAAFINRAIMLPFLKSWMKAVDFTNPIIWTFLPTRTALDLILNIDHELSVYYCIANFDELVKDREKLRESEKKIIKAVDLIFAQGEVLKERCLKYNRNVSIFPFGVRKDLFGVIGQESTKPCPEDMRNIRGAKIGYVGGLHKHVDYELLEDMARKKPEWSVVLIGPDQINYSSKAKPGNIIMLGMKKYEELPDYLDSLDLCMIPYRINEYTRTVYPTKLNEYLLRGKPVVSTALPEINEFNRIHSDVVYVAQSREDFLKRAEDALIRNAPEEIAKRKEAAGNNTWENRILQMSQTIEKEIEKKAAYRERSWKENLIEMYRASKRRIAKIAATLVILYFVIFYSPLLWIMASPLEISQVPGKADTIVVFGGGVGEGGSPGESTIERARFSVDLYRKGLAEHIVYSSGYTFKYNDAENMKLFARSMGIPERNVILEQKAGSTYENVKYTTGILRNRGFRKILLVTSPYNTRRASLVYRHIAGDISVIYTPVPDPKFYYRAKPVKLKQIKAVMHEYLGIVYYFLKGYIK